MMRNRILGYDLARCLAVFGMVLVNFHIVMGGETGSPLLKSLLGLFEGRAAATFVILAGVGISLMTARVRGAGDDTLLASQRNSLLKRAALLVVLGLAYAPIWPADILHFYGFYIGIASFFLVASEKRLWHMAFFFTLGFPLLVFSLDYEAGWDWETLEYHGFWTVAGMMRHIFFNGFHPVFPWAAFLFIGMWLGRQAVSDAKRSHGILWVALALAVSAEVVSRIALSVSGDPESDLAVLLTSKAMPPMPLYMVAGGGTAITVILLCVGLGERAGDVWWLRPFIWTGQMSLTIYVAHVIIGMGSLEALGMLTDQSVEIAAFSAVVFCAGAVAFASLWRLKFSRGPLEWLFRKLVG